MCGSNDMLVERLLEQLRTLPIIDSHTHLDASHLAARGLHDILLYHMSITDLYSAGCPDGARLSAEPDEKEITGRIERALPYLDKVRNTSICWGWRTILSELYDWNDPITKSNWRKIHDKIAECSKDKSWTREILKRCGIIRASTEWFLRRDGSADDILDYSLEWAFFTRTQWGQNDIPIYELENVWQQDEPAPPLPVTLKEWPTVKRQIKTIEDVRAAIEHYCKLIPYGKTLTTAQHISTYIDYQQVSDSQMVAALKNRGNATTVERDIYASYILNAFLGELEKHGDEIVYQFSLAAEPLPYETSSILLQRTIGQLGEIIARYPKLHFQCTVSSRHGNQSLCTLARELPNFSLSGYWWHNFFPDAIKQVCSERLDMLALNKQIGFFSDAYCVDWVYGKTKIVLPIMAEVLAEKINRGQYTFEQAIDIAAFILKDSSEQLLGLNNKKRAQV